MFILCLFHHLYYLQAAELEDEIDSMREWLVGAGLMSTEAAEFANAQVARQRIGSVAKMQYLLSTAKLAERLAEVGMEQDSIGLVLQALGTGGGGGAGGSGNLTAAVISNDDAVNVLFAYENYVTYL